MEAIKIKISGDVQGVSYRFWANKAAKKIGVAGWAKNDHDGSVTILAQGEKEALSKMIAWTKEGSPLSTVAEITVEEAEPIEGLKGFSVK